jgi:hypothetical protein
VVVLPSVTLLTPLLQLQRSSDCLVAVCNANSTCQKKLLCFSCGQ